MKLHAGNNVVEKSGSFEESRFSIEASSKAFFILSDGLYSNKILAVVRELSTNAYDSHVDAGKADVPFDVHLPTHLTPVFFIRDYGTSMNHDSCMQLYTTYFRSTRNNSNDAVGCLGLGSKAPFAYSDSFTVEAYLNGMKRVYNAYKNEDGSPVFSLMHETDTNEPDGIKVAIQVNSNDIDRFRREATKVYEFFKVRPNFIGEKLNFPKTEKILSGDNWYFDDNASGNLIIMGQIAYPLDHYQIMDNGKNKEAKFIQNSDGLRIFVKIGDVDITPSRESLSYSKDTKENIRNVINNILNEITVKIEDQIKSQPSLFKARMRYVQISDQCSSIKSAIESLQKSINWNDTPLFDNIISESISIKNKISLTMFDKSNYRKKINSNIAVESMHFKSYIKFFVDDLNRGGQSRIKQHMRNSTGSQSCYVYKLASGETVDDCSLYAIMGGADRNDVVLTSTLPKVEYNRTYSGSDNGPAIQVRIFNEESGKFESCNMSVKFENAHYFAESKDSVDIGNRHIDISQIEFALNYLHSQYPDEVDGITFYAVKPSVIKNRGLDNRSNWTNGNEIVKKLFAQSFDKHKQNIISVHRKMSLSCERNDRWKEIFAMTKTDNVAKGLINEYNEYAESIESMSEEMSLIYSIATMFNINTINWSNIKLNDDSIAKKFDKEVKKYPMLKLIGNVWNDNDKQLVADYIDTVENHTHLVTNL